MSLSVTGLEHCFGRRRVLAGVTLSTAPGQLIALVGPNAAGKTTLLRCLSGVLTPTRGTVAIDGVPLNTFKPPALARRLAYVAQAPTCAARFTTRQVVSLGRYALGADEARVEDALRNMGVADVAEQPVAALSGGQRQRVSLARALAQAAPDGHLILDEPTAAMDLRYARRTFGLLRRRVGEGLTVIVALHDLTVAAEVADVCWVLDGGRSVADGPVREVLDPPLLEAVYGVPFEWVDRADGSETLLAVGRESARSAPQDL